MRRWIPILTVLLLSTGWAAAQIQVDKRRPAPAKGTVWIENDFGTLKVIGWDKNEVAVTGTLASGSEGLDFSGDKEGLYVEVEVPDWFFDSDDDTEFRSELEVYIPKGSSISIETVNSSIEVSGVNGKMEFRTVNGPMKISGNPRVVEAETLTGTIEITAQAAEMRVETVSGAVKLRGVTRTVEVSTTSGGIEVHGHALKEVDLETTSGKVLLDADFLTEGEVEIETFSGPVDLILRDDIKAQFELVTFSGKIDSVIGPKPRREGKFNPYQKLRFATGLNEFDISAETYSGNITIRMQGAAQ